MPPLEQLFDVPIELPVDLPWGLEPRQVLAALVGAALLLFGRRLYWLALGAVGFGVGLWLFQNVRGGFSDPNVRLAIALALGIGGAVAAVLLQKVAVSVIGFFGGLMAVFWLSEPWRADLGTHVWWLALLGAVLGTVFSSAVFEAGLVVATSLLGATLVAGAFPLAPPYGTALFVGLVLVGLVAQTRSGRKGRRQRRSRREDDG